MVLSSILCNVKKMRGRGGGGGGGGETSRVEIPMSSNQAYTSVGGVGRREQTYEVIDEGQATGGGGQGEGREGLQSEDQAGRQGEEQEAVYEQLTV